MEPHWTADHHHMRATGNMCQHQDEDYGPAEHARRQAEAAV